MSQSRSGQDVYSREYGQGGAALSFQGRGSPDIYSRDYVRGGIGKQPSVRAAYTERIGKPVIRNAPMKGAGGVRGEENHIEPQPSIFDKISRFLQGVLGSK